MKEQCAVAVGEWVNKQETARAEGQMLRWKKPALKDFGELEKAPCQLELVTKDTNENGRCQMKEQMVMDQQLSKQCDVSCPKE